MTSVKHEQATEVAAPASLHSEQLQALAELFPQAFTEGKVDFDKLRALLGDTVDARPERYAFSWAGKRQAIDHAQAPSQATLLPVRAASVDFDTTGNLFIEGDNLEVLKLLHRSYFNSVKMIYIDPPYNTGNDFVYPDDFTDALENYLQVTGQKDAEGNLRTSNPETSGRYHSAWLSMMYPRLVLARSLMRDDGVILVSIDDHEVHNLRLLMNEVFGEENFVATIVWQKRYVSNMTAQYISDMHDYILVYARQIKNIDVAKLPRSDEQLADYQNPDNDPRGVWRAQDLSASKPYTAGMYTIVTPAGLEVNPPPGRYWRCSEAKYNEWLADGRIWFGKSGQGRPMLKVYLSEAQAGVTPNTWWSYDFAGHNKEATLEVKALFDGASPFDTPKPVKLIRRMLELFSDPNALVLDFFAGSGTTAQAVLEMNHDDGGNRRFVLVQLPEPTPEVSEARKAGYRSIADISMERIRRVIVRLKQAAEGTLKLSTRETPEDFGFRVFKLGASNLRRWAAPAEDSDEAYLRQLELMANTLAAGSKPDSIIWEAALREGYSLSARITKANLSTNEVYQVTDPAKKQAFYICLDDRLDLRGLQSLGLTRDTLFICQAQSLDDTTGANLALMCRLKTI